MIIRTQWDLNEIGLKKIYLNISQDTVASLFSDSWFLYHHAQYDYVNNKMKGWWLIKYPRFNRFWAIMQLGVLFNSKLAISKALQINQNQKKKKKIAWVFLSFLPYKKEEHQIQVKYDTKTLANFSFVYIALCIKRQSMYFLNTP